MGAGTGTVCYGFKGGTETPRARSRAIHPGALVQTNFGSRRDLMVTGLPLGALLEQGPTLKAGPGSVMVVLATDAPLDSRQLGRLAMRAAFGLARTGSYCSQGSGDFVVAFSTANRRAHHPAAQVESITRLSDEHLAFEMLLLGVVEAVEEAVLNALVAAETMTGRDGHTVHALPHGPLLDFAGRRQPGVE